MEKKTSNHCSLCYCLQFRQKILSSLSFWEKLKSHILLHGTFIHIAYTGKYLYLPLPPALFYRLRPSGLKHFSSFWLSIVLFQKMSTPQAPRQFWFKRYHFSGNSNSDCAQASQSLLLDFTKYCLPSSLTGFPYTSTRMHLFPCVPLRSKVTVEAFFGTIKVCLITWSTWFPWKRYGNKVEKPFQFNEQPFHKHA